MPARDHLLRLDGVSVELDNGHRDIPLVRDATLDVRKGEIVCLVGESGSGKSVTARTVMGLTQLDRRMKVGGTALFDDVDLFSLDAERMRRMRGRDLAMVFQEPLSSLDPVFTVESQLREGLRRRERLSPKAETARLSEALQEVGIHDCERVLRSYPHALSGGMCQRVMIAMALLARPRLLLADEPTTALDVTIQAQILELIDRLRHEEDMSVLLVTHDMGVAAEVADRVVVMYAGRVVEDADPQKVFAAPAHPYTGGLLACIPPMVGARPVVLPAIGGSVPDPSSLPGGCAFHPRCVNALPRCTTEDPPLEPEAGGTVACWNPLTREAAPAPELVHNGGSA
ncbi:ABC transporter ATP-binding protein [Pseudactinotalea suaedae]|uniref:ABC transporter ATP-binding protein n=1 Tax=Pseudactinotalea suaedae TaxID=1524924 RepID=UPI001391757F|nr:ABC transporter ATP-binding protein [Pseudactinotalea suaedae]